MTCVLALQACGGGSSSGASEDAISPEDLLAGIERFDVGEASPVLGVVDENSVSYQLLEDQPLIAVLPGADVVSGLISLPAHGLLEFSADIHRFRYIPEPDYHGSDGYVYLSDGRSVAVTLNVFPVDDTPRLSPDFARIATQGQLYSQVLQAVDPDGDGLRFYTQNLPAWLSLDPASGVLSGLPTVFDVGTTTPFTVGVTDDTGLSDEITAVRLDVGDTEGAPVVDATQFPDLLLAREVVEVRVFADDALLTLSIEPNPFIDSRVTGGLVRLEVADVLEVTQVDLVAIVTDELGSSTRQIVPVELRPLSVTTLGQTLLGSTRSTGVNVVVLGDGYRSSQRDTFEADAEALLATLEADEFVSDHLGLINLHSVWQESVDSGADDGDFSDTQDTAFDSRYNCNGLERLICANRLAVFEAAFSEYPDVDEIVLLVNDARYGGSAHAGDGIAIASSAAPGLALHEMGHSLANLGDEYVDDSFVPPEDLASMESANIALDPATPPWSHWLTVGDVPGIDRNAEQEYEPGVFEGAAYVSFGRYRPTLTSRMRNVDSAFGPVNGEAWILALYTKARPVQIFSPVTREINVALGQLLEFSVTPWFDASIQRIDWRLDGAPLSEVVTSGEPQSELIAVQLPAGRHELSLSVTDVSGAIRRPPPHAAEFRWSWDINVL